MNIQYTKLEKLINNYLTKHGVSFGDAKITTTVLLEGTIRGYPNHGIDRLLQIKEGFDNGTINPYVECKLIREHTSTAVIDACGGLGHPIADYAMHIAIKKAHSSGIGLVGTLNASHLGILSYYSEIASSNSCLGIVMSTSSPAVVLKGGKIKTLGTNPISYSLPFSPYHLTSDFSTSKVARGTIFQHLKENKKIPSNWAVDKNGSSTDNPQFALEGGIQTIDGDVKGSLFSLLISIMAGHMIGGVINPEVCGTRYMDKSSNKGDIFIAIHIPSLTSLEVFQEQTRQLCDFIENQNISFRIPGKGSHEKKLLALKEGIMVSDKLIAMLE